MDSKTPLQQVEHYIKHDRSFDAGVRLYNQLPGRNLAFARALNNAVDKTKMIEDLCYELRRNVGMSNGQFRRLMAQPVLPLSNTAKKAKQPRKAPVEKVQKKEDLIVEFDPDNIVPEDVLRIDLENANYFKLKDLVYNLGFKPKDNKKETIIRCLEQWKIQYSKDKERERLKSQLEEDLEAVKSEMTEEEYKPLRLRDEFPFLFEKDCPDELKILVADKITAHDRFVKAHKELFEAAGAEMYELAKEVVENFIENDVIYAELDYYREHKKPLGQHPIWDNRKELEEIKQLAPQDLVKKLNALRKNVSTWAKKVEENPEHEEIDAWKKKLKDYEYLKAETEALVNELE